MSETASIHGQHRDGKTCNAYQHKPPRRQPAAYPDHAEAIGDPKRPPQPCRKVTFLDDKNPRLIPNDDGFPEPNTFLRPHPFPHHEFSPRFLLLARVHDSASQRISEESIPMWLDSATWLDPGYHAVDVRQPPIP
jgi:hypothetical protein